MITHATPAEACTGSALGLLFRQARDAMWARMERELAAAGHELNFSQFITLKRLSAGPAGVTDLARAADLNPGAMTRLLASDGSRHSLVYNLRDAGQCLWIDRKPQRCRQRDAQNIGRQIADAFPGQVFARHAASCLGLRKKSSRLVRCQ